MLKQQAAETCRVGTFYLTEFEAACQVISFFLGPRRHKAVLRASAGSEELLTRPLSFHASRSRSKHPPTHARVRCERRKVTAADLRCEVRSFPRVRHGENRLRVGRVLVESSFAENIANSLVIPAQVTERCCLDAPARLILRGERHPRSAALEIPSLRRSSCFSPFPYEGA